MVERAIEAASVARMTLHPGAPFDCPATVRTPSHVPTPMIVHDRGRCLQTLRGNGEARVLP
jgi:hypothetical protein